MTDGLIGSVEPKGKLVSADVLLKLARDAAVARVVSRVMWTWRHLIDNQTTVLFKEKLDRD